MDNILNDKDIILDDFNPGVVAQKIASKMRKRRLLINLTQEALAQISGVSLGSLRRFENQHKISLQHLLQLALALDALDEFHDLFPDIKYQSIDDIIKGRKVKERKRGSNV